MKPPLLSPRGKASWMLPEHSPNPVPDLFQQESHEQFLLIHDVGSEQFPRQSTHRGGKPLSGNLHFLPQNRDSFSPQSAPRNIVGRLQADLWSSFIQCFRPAFSTLPSVLLSLPAMSSLPIGPDTFPLFAPASTIVRQGSIVHCSGNRMHSNICIQAIKFTGMATHDRRHQPKRNPVQIVTPPLAHDV